MRHRSTDGRAGGHVGRVRLSALAAAVAALLASSTTATAATTVAATSPAVTSPAVTSTAAMSTAEAPAPATSAALAYKRLDLTMQAQEKTNWCWAASGNTIATWFGRQYSQNEFCNAAFGRAQGSECPNSQATLGDVQNGLSWAGINAGSYVTGWLRYATVRSEIDANRPVETRIQWSSGGGHMHVLYGYDDSGDRVYWGDPWPSDDRYNWASHDWYVNNDSFSWTHSLYRIGA